MSEPRFQRWREGEFTETCAGCEEEFIRGEMRWVALMASKNLRGETVIDKAFVCDPCHQDPAHRKNKLKAHFFARGSESFAAEMAMRNTGRIGIG